MAGVSKLAGRGGGAEEQAAYSRREIPLGHMQATWDLGITAVYLASDAARCVNGDTIVRVPSSRALHQISSFCDKLNAEQLHQALALCVKPAHLLSLIGLLSMCVSLVLE